MRGTIRRVSDHHCELLASGWEFCATAPDSVSTPAEIASGALDWLPAAHGPRTAAACLRDLQKWSLSSTPRRFDAEDWWFRCTFGAAVRQQPGERIVLGFDGLAGIAQVWLNGELLLASDDMFTSHEVRAPNLRERNELVLRFRALDGVLAAKRPRPRWRAPMIENQQLRWMRQTVLGRTPGWSPPAAAVGPWGDVWIDHRRSFDAAEVSLRARVKDGVGLVEFEALLEPLDCELVSGQLVLGLGSQRHVGDLVVDRSSHRASAQLRLSTPTLWWPHTHGNPAMYSASIEVVIASGGQRHDCVVNLPSIGFRTVELDRDDNGFALLVNGERVFCRGACWTPPDVVSLRATHDEYARILDQVRAAGMNMLRVGGTMIYESDEFLDLCDRFGILVWQELMFANMDYPDSDPVFLDTVTTEIRQQVARLLPHACVAMICGNSEVEQQAAMWGASRDRWEPRLFHEVVPALLAELGCDVPYWPSSAHGGAFPHQVNQGTTSYYGVGAYLRPLDDARRSQLRFATECLGFANVPEDETIAEIAAGRPLPTHHPAWKSRVPRDLGAGWDFEDVRDHYFEQLVGTPPLAMRYQDSERYLALSRIVSAEVMAAAFREWRRSQSTCQGALVWFLRDLWPGAGWGIVDSCGRPKAPYYLLRRLLQPRAVFFSDEGSNGLYLHVLNESATRLRATLTLTVYRRDGRPLAPHSRDLDVSPRECSAFAVVDWLPGFEDLNHAYRFAPCAHELVVATLRDETGKLQGEDFYFPAGSLRFEVSDPGLEARARRISAGGFEVSVRTRGCARFVSVRVPGFVADDQYFHLAPGTERTIGLTAVDASAALRGTVLSLNGSGEARIEIDA